LERVAWYDAQGTSSPPVGQKEPNAWGLYDMHGSVCEWCEDWFGEYRSGAAIDPKGAASGTSRVFRGGSLFHKATQCRSASRDWLEPGVSITVSGFRVVVAGPP
jgi:formylglycine-generating enzyme required for sulfatase activity